MSDEKVYYYRIALVPMFASACDAETQTIMRFDIIMYELLSKEKGYATLKRDKLYSRWAILHENNFEKFIMVPDKPLRDVRDDDGHFYYKSLDIAREVCEDLNRILDTIEFEDRRWKTWL